MRETCLVSLSRHAGEGWGEGGSCPSQHTSIGAARVIPRQPPRHARLAVPGAGWHITFDAPKLTPTAGVATSLFSGQSDRLQVSFFAEAPRCPGGDSNEVIYNCFAKSLQQSPLVAWDTERANTASNRVQVMYITHVEHDGKQGTAFNVNVLFAHRGKWADFHGSIASPNKEDLKQLMEIVNSVRVVDDTAEGQPAGAAAVSGRWALIDGWD